LTNGIVSSSKASAQQRKQLPNLLVFTWPKISPFSPSIRTSQNTKTKTLTQAQGSSPVDALGYQGAHTALSSFFAAWMQMLIGGIVVCVVAEVCILSFHQEFELLKGGNQASAFNAVFQ
jgi:hypothetical protein